MKRRRNRRKKDTEREAGRDGLRSTPLILLLLLWLEANSRRWKPSCMGNSPELHFGGFQDTTWNHEMNPRIIHLQVARCSVNVLEPWRICWRVRTTVYIFVYVIRRKHMHHTLWVCVCSHLIQICLLRNRFQSFHSAILNIRQTTIDRFILFISMLK